MKLESCRGCDAISGCGGQLYNEEGGNGVNSGLAWNNDHVTGMQALVFGCVEFFSTQCTYDISNMAGTGTRAGGAFSAAMRAFAQCADRSPQPEGYCHGAIKSAAALSNQAVCNDGSTLNIGFHIRIPCPRPPGAVKRP
jgi:hypothetical protein